MSGPDLSEKLRNFIFQYIDSVEIIEVLALLYAQRNDWKNAIQVSQELRSNQSSIQSRLQTLQAIGLVEECPDNPGHFCYRPRSPELDEIAIQLLEEYKKRRHKVMELVFSPMKQALKFADAFIIGKDPNKKGAGDV